MNKKTLVVTLIILGAVVVVFHQSIIKFLSNATSARDSRPVVGVVEAAHGEVEILAFESLDPKTASPNTSLRHQDTLVVGHKSQAIVRMKNGLAFEIEPQSSLFFEKLDYVLISIQRGNLKVIEKGAGDHEVIILKDGVLQDPEGRNIPAASLLKEQTSEEDETDTTPTPPAATSESQSLSDAYISSIVQNQRGFLNRCYAQHLRNQPHSKGEIHLTFTIQTGGDVANPKVLKSTFTDSELQRCVISALERARFRSFIGEPIIVNYPIYFE